MIKLNQIRIHYIIRLVIFWMLYFALFRVFFILYHHTKIPDGQHSETGLGFIYALRLDLATACALSFIPIVLWAFQQFYKKRFIHRINLLYNFCLITLVSVLSVANVKMYGEWGTLLSARALNYLLYPKEVFSFISLWSVLLLLSGCAIFTYIGIKSYRRFIVNFSVPVENIKFKIAQIILIPGIMFIGMRGGLGVTPINESSAYYSNLQINNHIATNNLFYLVHSIVDANDSRNPYIYMDAAKAKAIRDKLFTLDSHNRKNILKINRPNVIIIVLESWTADIISSLGGELNVTPHFDQLRKEGMLFSQMYGSGFRTEQGLASILSGFPAQPNNSIMTTPSKAEKLPALAIELGKQGYQSSFYYGGEVEFANMKSYLLNSHYEKIIDKKNFDKSQWNSKWGAHDEFVFSKQLEGLKNEKEPFFSTVLTLSTHEPFEVTMQTPFTGGEEAERFKKAAYYTDYCLWNYFNEAKKQPWYNHTVFILVADHGHRLPRERDMDFSEGRRITGLIIGGALQDSLRGTVVDKVCNQNDIPATLLSQLDLPHEMFDWSRDIFNAGYKQFAYFSNENALGWKTPKQEGVYFYPNNKVDYRDKNLTMNDTLLMQSKAYLQVMYQQYLDY